MNVIIFSKERRRPNGKANLEGPPLNSTAPGGQAACPSPPETCSTPQTWLLQLGAEDVTPRALSRGACSKPALPQGLKHLSNQNPLSPLALAPPRSLQGQSSICGTQKPCLIVLCMGLKHSPPSSSRMQCWCHLLWGALPPLPRAAQCESEAPRGQGLYANYSSIPRPQLRKCYWDNELTEECPPTRELCAIRCFGHNVKCWDQHYRLNQVQGFREAGPHGRDQEVCSLYHPLVGQAGFWRGALLVIMLGDVIQGLWCAHVVQLCRDSVLLPSGGGCHRLLLTALLFLHGRECWGPVTHKTSLLDTKEHHLELLVQDTLLYSS